MSSNYFSQSKLWVVWMRGIKKNAKVGATMDISEWKVNIYKNLKKGWIWGGNVELLSDNWQKKDKM